jgi:hypothetical protein
VELSDRLSHKAKAGISNPALVTTDLLTAALNEANELIGDKNISDTVKLDIAYFRLMLMVKKDGVDDIELDIYSKAMKIVKDTPSTIDGEIVANSKVIVKQRVNRWV